MPGKKLALAIVVVTLATLVLPLAACQGEISFTTASLSNATMCKSVDPQTMEPVEKTNTFSADTSEIFCSVKLSNAPSNTVIKAEWLYVQGEADYLIDSVSITTEGSRHIGFSIPRPDTAWPTGDYKVVLYLDDNEELSTSFKVQ